MSCALGSPLRSTDKKSIVECSARPNFDKNYDATSLVVIRDFAGYEVFGRGMTTNSSTTPKSWTSNWAASPVPKPKPFEARVA